MSFLSPISISARWALQRGTENCRLGKIKTLISAPHQRFILPKPALQPTTFGEKERPTTNPSISPPFITRGLSLSDPEHESDRLLPQTSLAQRKIGMSLGSLQNKSSVPYAQGVGMNEEKRPSQKTIDDEEKSINPLEKWGKLYRTRRLVPLIINRAFAHFQISIRRKPPDGGFPRNPRLLVALS